MISRLFITAFTVKRIVYPTGSGKGALATNGTVYGHIQQLSQEKVSTLASSFKVSHAIWCAVGSDVQLGDVLENGSDKYSVQAVQNNNSIGFNKHLEILAMK